METKKLTLKQKGLTGYVLVASAIAAVGGILFGFDTGVISGAILFIVKQWNLTARAGGIRNSSVLIGAVLGAIAGGALGDRLGRKKSIIGATILFLAGHGHRLRCNRNGSFHGRPGADRRGHRRRLVHGAALHL